jgi:hypothetical protein
MPEVNNKVSQQQFYTEFTTFRKERTEALQGVEERLGGKIDDLAKEIRGQNQQQGERIAGLEQCAKDHGERIDDAEAGMETLKGTDRRWGALGAVLGPVLGAVAGWFAGQR